MSLEDDRTRLMAKPTADPVERDLGISNAELLIGPKDRANATPRSVNVLPNGTRLGEFEVIDLIGEGGFGIVYLALDHSLDRRIALKEYIPSSLATRGPGLAVSIKSPRHAQTFEAGLRSFVNEAKLLAHFDHPALVKVHRFWEANGTAYMAMPLYEGVTLKQALSERTSGVSEAWLKSLLAPLTDALALMHNRQCYHRDIAPDNLLILRDERPVLLDFGAARRVIGDMTQALTVILKPGYAPIEQYAETADMKQGPWTDVYALAALIYYAIAGRAPLDSVARLVNDTMVPAEQIGRGRFSDQFLKAIDAALVVHPESRTQSIVQFREALGIHPTPPTGTNDMSAPVDETEPPNTDSTALRQYRRATAATTYTKPAKLGGVFAPPRSLWLAGAIVLAGVGSVAVWTLSGFSPAPSTRTEKDLKPGTAVAPTTTGKIAPPNEKGTPPNEKKVTPPPNLEGTATVPKPDTTPAAKTEAAATPKTDATVPPKTDATAQPKTDATTPPTAEKSAVTAEVKPKFSPVLISDLIYRSRAPDWNFTAAASPEKVEIDKDFIQMRFRSEYAGFLYVFMLGSNNRDWWMVFPNGKDKNNQISAGEELALPRKHWPLQANGPVGITRFLALVSQNERDFGAGGLKSSRDFGKFDLTAAAKAYQISADPVALFSGRADCSKSEPDCGKRFGAAQFQIEEITRRSVGR